MNEEGPGTKGYTTKAKHARQPDDANRAHETKRLRALARLQPGSSPDLLLDGLETIRVLRRLFPSGGRRRRTGGASRGGVSPAGFLRSQTRTPASASSGASTSKSTRPVLGSGSRTLRSWGRRDTSPCGRRRGARPTPDIGLRSARSGTCGRGLRSLCLSSLAFRLPLEGLFLALLLAKGGLHSLLPLLFPLLAKSRDLFLFLALLLLGEGLSSSGLLFLSSLFLETLCEEDQYA